MFQHDMTIICNDGMMLNWNIVFIRLTLRGVIILTDLVRGRGRSYLRYKAFPEGYLFSKPSVGHWLVLKFTKTL